MVSYMNYPEGLGEIAQWVLGLAVKAKRPQFKTPAATQESWGWPHDLVTQHWKTETGPAEMQASG